MPYKDKQMKKLKDKQYYVRTRVNLTTNKLSTQVLHQLLDETTKEILKENYKMKKIIILHNIKQKTTDDNIDDTVEEKTVINDSLSYYKDELKKLIDINGADLLEKYLEQFENDTKLYYYDDMNHYEKNKYYHQLLDYLERS